MERYIFYKRNFFIIENRKTNPYVEEYNDLGHCVIKILPIVEEPTWQEKFSTTWKFFSEFVIGFTIFLGIAIYGLIIKIHRL